MNDDDVRDLIQASELALSLTGSTKDKIYALGLIQVLKAKITEQEQLLIEALNAEIE